MVVLRPLYGIPEAGTHWWATYHKHHRQQLDMETSMYDACLLLTTKKLFGVVGMQTDDTLILADEKFSEKEDIELKRAKIEAKPKEVLSTNSPLMFNGCIISQQDQDNVIEMRQKDQGKKIQLVDPSQNNFRQKYREQRARAAYIATICQPEASFDLSRAAQSQEPTETDVKDLNKRLKWQLDNLNRRL